MTGRQRPEQGGERQVRVLVAGASGFVGSRLCPRLVADGHDVAALTRHPGTYAGSGTAVGGDVADLASLRAALAGCDVAVYLVHSLDSADFVRRDADAARCFATAAREAGVSRIVYLGGLGDDSDDLSAHLRSRREVERLLGGSGVPVTVLRAGIVVGHGGISWEITRQLVTHLPVMVTPRWVQTRTQPIALDDVAVYLAGVVGKPETAGAVYDVGGPEALTYLQMMRRAARVMGRPLVVVPVPLLTPRLSSRWLSVVTDVDPVTARALVDSMTNEVVVHESAIHEVAPRASMSYEEAVRVALRERTESRAAA